MIEAGQKPPQRYEPPETPNECHDLIRAFWELSTDRQIGFGPGPIPRHSIDIWCDRRGITGQSADDFSEYIRAMDSEYLSFDPESAEKKRSSRQLTPDLFDALTA